MRLTSALTLLLLPITLVGPACSGSGDETGTTQSSTGPGGTDTSSSGGALTEPTTGTSTGSSTGEPVTGTSTGEPVTGTTGTTLDPSASSTGPIDTTGEPGTGTTASESSSDTGVTPFSACETDEDCALHNDCCDCYGLPAGEPDANCKKGCDQTTCDVLGIDQAVCRFGVCTTERIDCDGSKVLCKALPPDCPKGQVPGVAGECWSGQCVPALSCDVVPDCGVCPDGAMCVQKIAKPTGWPSCEPIPAECGGEVDCECAGSFVCTGIFNACNDLGEDLSCGCPVC